MRKVFCVCVWVVCGVCGRRWVVDEEGIVCVWVVCGVCGHRWVVDEEGIVCV